MCPRKRIHMSQISPLFHPSSYPTHLLFLTLLKTVLNFNPLKPPSKPPEGLLYREIEICTSQNLYLLNLLFSHNYMLTISLVEIETRLSFCKIRD